MSWKSFSGFLLVLIGAMLIGGAWGLGGNYPDIAIFARVVGAGLAVLGAWVAWVGRDQNAK